MIQQNQWGKSDEWQSPHEENEPANSLGCLLRCNACVLTACGHWLLGEFMPQSSEPLSEYTSPDRVMWKPVTPILQSTKNPALGGAADQGWGSSIRLFILGITRSAARTHGSPSRVGCGVGMVSYGWRAFLAVLFSAMGQMLLLHSADPADA